MTKTIHLNPARITGLLSVVVIGLVLMNLLVVYLHFVKGYQHLKGFLHAFYLDTEANFPSLYSALAIFLCSVLLWCIGSTPTEKGERRSIYWKFLSFVFVFLAIDEFASIHEDLITPIKSLVSNSAIESDYLYFAWLIPYGILTVVLAVAYLKFFFKLPPRTRWLFAFSAFLFLSGAVVMEMIGGKYWSEQGWPVNGPYKVDLRYALTITAEEFLEMAGILVFIHALLCYYITDRKDTYVFEVSDSKLRPPSTASTEQITETAHS